jgi:hypothetical protein
MKNENDAIIHLCINAEGKGDFMSGNFFDNYKKFVVLPQENEDACKKEYRHQDYERHFIVTLSLYDPLISCWKEATKHEVSIKESLGRVVRGFNEKEHGFYHLQLLELTEDKPYLVLALSCAIKKDKEQEDADLSYIVEKAISNSLYNEECWYRLIGEKGRIKRQLFCCTYKEYTI